VNASLLDILPKVTVVLKNQELNCI